MLYSNQGAWILEWKSEQRGNVGADEEGARQQWFSQKPSHGLQKEGKACASVFEVLLGQAENTHTHTHTHSDCLLLSENECGHCITLLSLMVTNRGAVDAWWGRRRRRRRRRKSERSQNWSLFKRRLFAEKCQRSHYPVCAEWTEQSKPLSRSLTLSPSMHVNTHTHTHHLLYEIDHSISSEIKVLFNVDGYEVPASSVYSRSRVLNLCWLMSCLRQSSNNRRLSHLPTHTPRVKLLHS